MKKKKQRKENYFRLKKMKKVLNNSNIQRNANQTHNEILPLICQNGYHQRTQLKNIGENGGTRKPMCTVHGTTNWCSHHGKQYRLSQKIKIELPYDSNSTTGYIFKNKQNTE